MKNARKVFVWLMVFSLILTMAACGASRTEPAGTQAVGTTARAEEPPVPEKKEKVELNFGMIAFANEIPGWTAMIEAANKQLEKQDISIKVTKIPAQGWPEYYQKLVTQMAAGNAPDIGRIAESFMPQLVTKEQAVDLTEYLTELDMSSYYEATFKNAGYKNGKYYGVPSGVYYMVMYYNKDMFDKAGLAHPSKDWNNALSFEQVKDYARKLTSGSGANKIFGYSAGPYMAFVGMYNLSSGGKNVFNEDGTSAMNDPVTKRVYQWFDDMLRTDKSMPRPTDTKVMNATEMFKSGRIGMVVDGTWMLNTMKDIKKFKVGIAAVPAGNGKAYSSQFVDSFFLLKGSKYEKEAWEALKAMISKEGFDALAPTGTGGAPIHKQSLEAANASLASAFDKEDLATLSEALNHTVSVPYNEFYEQVDQKVNAAIDEWLLGKITSDQFADKVHGFVTEGAEKAKAGQ